MTPEQKALETIATIYCEDEPFDHLALLGVIRQLAFDTLEKGGADMSKYEKYPNVVMKYKAKDGSIVETLDYGDEHRRLCVDFLARQ